MWSSLLAVAMGGALGALARFATVESMQKWLGSGYPYGTLMVNCLGSFLAGFILILILERLTNAEFWRLFFVVGFLGAYTTFSSFSWETWSLFQMGRVFAALSNVVFNNVGSLTMAFLGMNAARFAGNII
jgi:CrcB protein